MKEVNVGAMHSICTVEGLELRLLLSLTPSTLEFPGDGSVVDGIVMDSAGNLYGTNYAGGANGGGTVWEIPKGTTTIKTLYSFTNGPDGFNPSAIMIDGQGNLYGAAYSNGAGGAGTIWEIAKDSGTLTTLYSFTNAAEGGVPSAIAIDNQGNLYGTAETGGILSPKTGRGEGTIWELAKGSSVVTVLYSFTGGAGGSEPTGITLDANGNIYGTSNSGGNLALNDGLGFGTIWKLAKGSSNVTTLYSFTDNSDGETPTSVTVDANDNLYGTADGNQDASASATGSVWELPKGNSGVSVLHTFSDAEGSSPDAIVRDQSGNLFGAATLGHTGDSIVWKLPQGAGPLSTVAFFPGSAAPEALAIDNNGNMFGTTFEQESSVVGTIWELAKGSSQATTLYTFSNQAAVGSLPGIAVDIDDNLFGVTFSGGANSDGSIWELPSNGSPLTTLYSFTAGADGRNPGGITIDGNGNLYGTTSNGGAYNAGTIWELKTGSGTPITLYSFPQVQADVQTPAAITIDKNGDLFGTTSGFPGDDQNGDGTVWELVNGSNSLTTLTRFTNTPEGGEGIAVDDAGDLFGSIRQASNGHGYVWELAAGSNTATTVYSFGNGGDGDAPWGVAIGASQNVYVAASNGFLKLAAMDMSAPILKFAPEPAGLPTPGLFNIGLEVHIEDSDGYTIENDSSVVTLSIASGPSGATLGGDTTAAAEGGVADFLYLSLTIPGTYTFTAVDGNDTPAVSIPFVVAQPTSNQLAFVQQPANSTTASTLGTVTVNVEGPTGALLTSDHSDVTIAIADSPNSLTLQGTTTVVAVNGVATFRDLLVPTAGTYLLFATDGADAVGESSFFTVTGPVSAPGLIPTILHSTLPAIIVTGSVVHAHAVVDIASGIASSAVAVDIYASADGAIDGDSILLGSVSMTRKIRADETFAVTVPIESLLPANLSGNYTLLAQATDSAGTKIVSRGGPALSAQAPFISFSESVVGTTLQTSAVSGSKTNAKVKLNITNDGNITSVGESQISIFVSTDDVAADGKLVRSINMPIVLKPGASRALNLPLVGLPAVMDGNYNLIVQITDARQNVTQAVSPNQYALVAPIFLLVPSSASISAAGKGTTIVSFTITNQGNIAPSGLSTIALYASPGDTTGNGTQLYSRVQSLPLAPGKSRIFHLNLTAAQQSEAADGKLIIDVTDSTLHSNTLIIADLLPATD